MDLGRALDNTNLPTLRESGLGTIEYDAVTQALEAAPEVEPPVKKHRGSSGKYTSYKAANRAKIVMLLKMAMKGQESTFFKNFLSYQSTDRYFKKLYQQELEKLEN